MDCQFLPKIEHQKCFFAFSVILDLKFLKHLVSLKEVDVCSDLSVRICPFWQKTKIIYEFNHFFFHFIFFEVS